MKNVNIKLMKKILLILAIIVILAIGLILLVIFLKKSRQITKLTCEQAIDQVLGEPEVLEYQSENPNAKIECDHEENNGWVIHVYEIVSGDAALPSHSATFDWYFVDGQGQVQKYNL